MLARQILALVVLTNLGIVSAQTPYQAVTLSSLQELSRTELHYSSTTIDACQLLLYDTTGVMIKEDWAVSALLTFTSINNDLAGKRRRNKLRASGLYDKGAFQVVELDDYLVVLMRYKSDGEFIPTGLADDLALWEKVIEGYRLIKIYPEYVGDCLYCKVTLLEHHGKTIAFEVGGVDGMDIWGQRMYFDTSEDGLRLYRDEHLSGYNNTDILAVTMKLIYPNNIKNYMMTTGTDYDLNGNISERDVTVETLDIMGNPLMITFAQDSLVLTHIPFEYDVPLIKGPTIPVKGKSLFVGSPRGNYVPVKWNGFWYQAKWKDVKP